MTVVCISRDTGGTHTLRRVAEELRQKGEEVVFLAQADSAAEKVLAEAGKSFRVVSSVEEVIAYTESPLFRIQAPRAILMSWCADVGREALPFLSECGTPTALVEDSWWHGGILDTLPAGSRPGLACVGTEHDRSRVLNAWEGYPSERVQVTGWPGFDECSGYDVAHVTERVRASLGLEANWPLVFLSVDNNPGIGELCRDVVDSLNEIDTQVYLVPAWHPAFDRTVLEERSVVELALGRFEAGALVDRGDVPTAELVMVTDVIIATYSNLLTMAAALRKEVIAVLYSETGYAQMRAELGVEEFPLVALGCAAKAGNRDELRELLERALGPGLGLEEVQERHFRLDGRNARRVAELVI